MGLHTRSEYRLFFVFCVIGQIRVISLAGAIRVIRVIIRVIRSATHLQLYRKNLGAQMWI